MDEHKDYSHYVTWGDALFDEGYTPIPNALYEHFSEIRIVDDKGKEVSLTLTDVGFIGILFSFKRGQGIFPTNKTIAKRADIHIRKVHERLAKLEKLGCLKRVKRLTARGDFTSSVLDFTPLREKLLNAMPKTALPHDEIGMTAHDEIGMTPPAQNTPQATMGIEADVSPSGRSIISLSNITSNASTVPKIAQTDKKIDDDDFNQEKDKNAPKGPEKPLPKPLQQVRDKMFTVTGKLEMSPVGFALAKRLFDDDIPLETVLRGIDLSVQRFKPKYKGDKIKSLSFCEGAIRELFEEAKGQRSSEDEIAATKELMKTVREMR